MFHTLAAPKNVTGIGEEEPELRIASEKEIVSHCDRIIASTEKEQEDLIKYYNPTTQNISVIPCGVNTSLFRPIEKTIARKELGLNNHKIVLFVGRMEPLKGAQQLLTAFSRIEGLDNSRLIIIGGDEYSQEYTQAMQLRTEELCIKDKVGFLGPVPHEKLPLYYNAADVSVIPSYYESFGLVALESLACGTPVIGTNVGALKKIIDIPEAGYIIENNSPDILAETLSKALSYNHNHAKDTEIIRAIAMKYDWRNIADNILEEYRNIRNNYTAAINNRRN
jgi:D-inositol-3-phosphate glycosyltransferase